MLQKKRKVVGKREERGENKACNTQNTRYFQAAKLEATVTGLSTYGEARYTFSVIHSILGRRIEVVAISYSWGLHPQITSGVIIFVVNAKTFVEAGKKVRKCQEGTNFIRNAEADHKENLQKWVKGSEWRRPQSRHALNAVFKSFHCK